MSLGGKIHLISQNFDRKYNTWIGVEDLRYKLLEKKIWTFLTGKIILHNCNTSIAKKFRLNFIIGIPALNKLMLKTTGYIYIYI